MIILQVGKKMTMKIHAPCFLARMLFISAILTAAFALGSGITPTLDRRVEQAGRGRERPSPAPGGGATVSSPDGKDLSGSQIEGIYLFLNPTLGYGGMVVMQYDPYLLLKDGTIYRNLQRPPNELDISKSRQMEPKMWGRWQRSGKIITVQWDDGTRKTWDKDKTFVNDWHIARPAGKSDRLNGRYHSMSGGGNTALGGSFSLAVIKDIVFFDNGSFTRDGVVSANERNSVSVQSKRKGSGTYVIDGYTIELRHDDGKAERFAFYFYPDSNNAIGIGNRTYTLRK
jgi:hypothetical protein